MSRIDELIERLCPDGVEYKKLEEIGSVTRGGNFQKKDFVESGFPCIHYGQIYTRYGLHVTETISFVSEETAAKSKKAHPGDVVMAVTSENIEDVCKCVTWLGNGEVAISGHTAIIHHNQNPKFMTYFFRSAAFDVQKKKLAHGTKVIEVTPSGLLDIKVPIPPMEIQEEIVRVLDSFAELEAQLEAELEAELEARRRQYSHYRDELLSFTERESVSWLKLGDVCRIIGGKDYKHLGEGSVPVYGSGGIMSVSVDEAAYDKPTVLLPRKGSISNVFYVDTPFWNVDTIFYTEIDTSMIVPRYMYHAVVNMHIEKLNTSNAARPALTRNVLKQVELPVPALEEQERIVAVLDQFDALVTDISQGILAEIETRRKQYAYYRDKLLTFEEKVA